MGSHPWIPWGGNLSSSSLPKSKELSHLRGTPPEATRDRRGFGWLRWGKPAFCFATAVLLDHPIRFFLVCWSPSINTVNTWYHVLFTCVEMCIRLKPSFRCSEQLEHESYELVLGFLCTRVGRPTMLSAESCPCHTSSQQQLTCCLHQRHIAGTAAQGRPFRSHAASWLSRISSLELQEILCHSRRYHPSSHGSVETNFVANGNYDCWQLWFVGRRFGFGGSYAAIHQLNHDWNLFGMVKPPSGRADNFWSHLRFLLQLTTGFTSFQWLHRGAWIDKKKRAGCLQLDSKKLKNQGICVASNQKKWLDVPKDTVACGVRHIRKV